MKTSYFKIASALLVIAVTGCREHEPLVENLPREAVSFTYVINGEYPLDYYVDSEIEFTSTSEAQGNAVWSFGDGATAQGNVVTHAYDKAGTYYVNLTIEKADGEKVEKRQPIMIADIKPLMNINPFEGVCLVRTTMVSFNIELPNPKNRKEEYLWIFPEGTTTADGTPIEQSTDTLPGEVKFSNVGSQTVRLQAKLDGRMLEEASINVQVGYTDSVPTLYYAVKGGNIMALKLPQNPPADMKISPFDMGVSSGQHPFNMLFKDSSLFVLDAGKVFNYVADDAGMGDGRINVMAKDGSKVETMITNAGGAGYEDPYFGYVDNKYLYFANRLTGICRVPLGDRNKVFNLTDYPYFVKNQRLGYYNTTLAYNSLNANFCLIDNTWYWGKVYGSPAIYRFTEADILEKDISGNGTAPEAGQALAGNSVKSMLWDEKNKIFYFTIWDEGYGGLYACTIDQLNAIGNKKSDLVPYQLKHTSGLPLQPVTEAGKGEGSSNEWIAICQLALDEATGDVYFGYRNAGMAGNAPTGLMRYNAATKQIETVLEGVEVYGLAVNNNPSQLF